MSSRESNAIAAKFVERFSLKGIAPIIRPLESEMLELETSLNIRLPRSYRSFMLDYGPIWTPDILNLVNEKVATFPDVQDFMKPTEIRAAILRPYIIEAGGKRLPVEFANDCMGNVFFFECDQIAHDDLPVQFWDHDFNTVKETSSGFFAFLERYLMLK